MQEAAPDVLADVVGAEQGARNLEAVRRAHEIVAAMGGNVWADDRDREDDEHQPEPDLGPPQLQRPPEQRAGGLAFGHDFGGDDLADNRHG